MEESPKSLSEGSNKPESQNLPEERDKQFKSTRHYSFYLITTLVLVLLGLFLLGLLPRLFFQEKLAAAASQTSLPRVYVLEVKGENKPVELTLPSSLDAINITPIWARVDGYISNFFVDIGDEVKANELLAEIETPELDQQLEQTLGELANSKARRNIAKITADRLVGLFQENPEAIAKQEVDQREADYEAAEASVASAQANVQRIQNTLNFKHITAPFDGIIIERDIDIGSLITAGSSNQRQQLFKIARTNVMRVFVNVPQRFFRAIKEGVGADVTISEFPEKIFKGFVARYAKALDPVARTLLTEVHILNPHNELFIGLYADVKFLLKPDNVYFVIPTNAVIIKDEGPKVAVLDENNTVHIVPVTLGLDHGKMMEITSGLQDESKVVLNPSDSIVEGVQVQVLDIQKQ